MKKLETVVEDIYKLLETGGDTLNKTYYDIDTASPQFTEPFSIEGVAFTNITRIVRDFGESMERLLWDQVIYKRKDKRTLRMSNIGKTDRYLWLLEKGTKQEKMLPHVLMKFLYGHMVEELVLTLAKLSGHKVTDQQRKISVNDIQGSIDCKIDGVLVDVKTTSSYGLKKFKDGTIRDNDPFGYVDQLRGYASALETDEGGWLAVDKTSGHMVVHRESFKYDEESIEDRIEHVKKMVKQEDMPEQCYETVPDGKSGNTKLSIECSYCVYKRTCFPDMKVFNYSTGPRFLVNISNYPKVPEIYNFWAT
jgi:hypothetical protein